MSPRGTTIPPSDVIEAIRNQKARYCRYIDTKQWSTIKKIALPEATWCALDLQGNIATAGGVSLVFNTMEAFCHHMTPMLASAQTIHLVSCGEFVQETDDTVRAIFGMTDHLHFPLRWTGLAGDYFGAGYYYETWRLVGGQWLLETLKLERTQVKENWLVRVGSSMLGWGIGAG